MKYYFIIFLFPSLLIAQIIISPHIVYTDYKNPFSNFIVQNQSDESYEIEISFKFGYPISDTLGNITMKYLDTLESKAPNISSYVKAFPKKFILMPNQKQIIGIAVRPPADLDPGTYWTRIIITSSKQNQINIPQTVNNNVTAKINLVLNQIITLLYRTKESSTGAEIIDVKTRENNNTIDFITKIKRVGNSPFLGDLVISIYDKNKNLILYDEQHIKLYYELSFKNSFDRTKLQPGTYIAEIVCKHNENEDLQSSDNVTLLNNNIIKRIELNIK